MENFKNEMKANLILFVLIMLVSLTSTYYSLYIQLLGGFSFVLLSAIAFADLRIEQKKAKKADSESAK